MEIRMDDKIVVVTGGAGFIGSHLVDVLIEKKASVKIVDDLSNGHIKNINKDADFIRGDIRDPDVMTDCLRDAEIVFHLAANTTTKETSMGWSDPYDEMRVNIEGTINILNCIIHSNSNAHIVFASSAAVYGEPIYTPVDERHPTEPVSPYGISKLAAEKYVFACFKEFGIKSTVARIFNTYGPRQSRYVIHDLVKKLDSNPDLLEVLGSGTNIRDYAYVSDTVNALILLAEKGARGEMYNVAGGNPISIKNLTALILNELNLFERTKTVFTGQSWKGDITKMVADLTKISALGFQSKTNLETGIKSTVNWLKFARN
jgi:UDP-glucose 4-epimerase